MNLMPDILNPIPKQRVDLDRLKEALIFCFAGGGADDVLTGCLNGVAVEDSTWDPQCYASDPFLNACR